MAIDISKLLINTEYASDVLSVVKPNELYVYKIKNNFNIKDKYKSVQYFKIKVEFNLISSISV